MSQGGFLYDYMVGGKCVNDPLMTPDKKEWMNCASRIANYNLLNAIIATVIVMTILIITLLISDAGNVYWLGAFTLGTVIIGSAVIGNMMSSVSAEARWDQAEAKVRTQLGDITDENFFTDFEKYDETKKKNVKSRWIDGAKKIREIEAEQSKVRAAELQAQGMVGVGVGQAMSGTAALGNLGVDAYKTFQSFKK